MAGLPAVEARRGDDHVDRRRGRSRVGHGRRRGLRRGRAPRQSTDASAFFDRAPRGRRTCRRSPSAGGCSPTSAGSSRRSRAPARTRRLVGTAAPEPGVLLSRFVESWPARPPDLPLAPGRPPVDRPRRRACTALRRRPAAPVGQPARHLRRLPAAVRLRVRRSTCARGRRAGRVRLALPRGPRRVPRPGAHGAAHTRGAARLARALGATTSRATGRRPKRPGATTSTCSTSGGRPRAASSSTGSGPDVLAVEREFSIEVGPHTVNGAIDRIDRADDGAGIRIVDYKTGKKEPSADDMADNLQLAVYHLAASRDERADGARPGHPAAAALPAHDERPTTRRSSPTTPRPPRPASWPRPSASSTRSSSPRCTPTAATARSTASARCSVEGREVGESMTLRSHRRAAGGDRPPAHAAAPRRRRGHGQDHGDGRSASSTSCRAARPPTTRCSASRSPTRPPFNLKEKVREALGPDADVTVATYHSFGASLVAEHAPRARARPHHAGAQPGAVVAAAVRGVRRVPLRAPRARWRPSSSSTTRWPSRRGAPTTSCRSATVIADCPEIMENGRWRMQDAGAGPARALPGGRGLRAAQARAQPHRLRRPGRPGGASCSSERPDLAEGLRAAAPGGAARRVPGHQLRPAPDAAADLPAGLGDHRGRRRHAVDLRVPRRAPAATSSSSSEHFAPVDDAARCR